MIVVGSGAAGLAAALAASAAGADVVVLEAAATLGGTTAMSGGIVWAPGHRVGGGSRPPGDDAEAGAYLAALGGPTVDVDACRTFTHDAARVVAAIEASTALRWEVLTTWPDYHPERSGAAAGGRSIWPRPLPVAADVAARLADPPGTGGDGARTGGGTPTDGGAAANDGAVLRGPVRGRVLVAALVAALEGAGVQILTGRRVTALVSHDGAVRGVRAGGESWTGRVVLAAGGFQHDAGLVAAHLPGAPIAPMGAPECRGDALRLALGVQADVGNMADGWWMPAVAVPGEQFGGVPFYRPLHSERAQPGSLMVDRAGRRFADEAQNYGDVGRAMLRFATGPMRFPAAPCWLLFDAAYRRRHPVGPLAPGDPDPPWLHRAADPAELAGRIGVGPGPLVHTLETFNAAAAKGEDPDFDRGASAYDRWIGDAGAAHPTLAPLREPPFYAVTVHAGCMGTKGGPRTDGDGRVLTGGRPVPGLYAAGNAAASPFGTATAAGGATIGPALVFGMRAGEAATTDGGTP